MSDPARLIRPWSVIAAAAALAAFVPARAAAQPIPPSRLDCAGYVIVPSGFAEPGRPTRLSIQKDGRLLETVSDWRISAAECGDVAASPTEELVVRSFSGGARCCETTRVFALDGLAPRLLLTYEGGNATGVEVRDIDGDGRKELILGDDSFAYFGDLGFAGSPARLPLVACFANGRFGDCSRQFPDLLRQGRDSYLARLKPAATPEALTDAKGNALGVLALSELLGEAEQGLDAVRRVVASEQLAGWLARALPQIRDWSAARAKKLKRGGTP